MKHRKVRHHQLLSLDAVSWFAILDAMYKFAKIEMGKQL
jgi:hypothetical protein